MAERLRASDHRLAGAIEKFNRSKAQFDELNAEMDRFFNKEPKPHHSVGAFDADAWEWVERFQIRQEPPLLLGVILGDVLHNLRSALDHMICQVSLLDDPSADCSDTQFPVASKSEEQFEGMANFRIPALNPEHRAFVKRIQPYHAGDEASRHPLSVLATLSNADKHRLVHPAFSALESEGLVEEAEKTLGPAVDDPHSPIRGFYVVKRGTRMEHGTPATERAASANLTLGVGFGEIGVPAEEIKRLGELVLWIIQTFQADFPKTVFEG